MRENRIAVGFRLKKAEEQQQTSQIPH
jgi:hypothetical protein